jgi:hypothetical protein
VTRHRFALASGIVFLALLPRCLQAQTNCDGNGTPPSPVQPAGITTQQIIQQAAASESALKASRNKYTYVEEIRIQTLVQAGLPGSYAVDGEYRQILNVAYDSSGRRLEQVTFAPQSTLRRISLTLDDFDDIHNYAAFVITTEELHKYSFSYAGQQHVDELDTYVFDIAPKMLQPKKRYFQGRIWVESHDLAIVKSCGKTVPDVILPPKKKRGLENIHATYITYREHIDGKYWFPAYTRSDDILEFRNSDVRTRQVIKYTGYRLAASRSPTDQHRSLSSDKATQ